METKRLFIGTFIDNSLFEKDYHGIINDFEEIIGAKWVEPDNLHFTYYFLGDVELPKIDEIKIKLKDLLISYQSTILFQGLGVFPNPKYPKVLWIGMKNEDGLLLKLYKQISDALSSIGIKPDSNSFSPHLTLSRIKYVRKDGFSDVLYSYKNKSFFEMNNFKIDLIESELTRTGPVYTKLRLYK